MGTLVLPAGLRVGICEQELGKTFFYVFLLFIDVFADVLICQRGSLRWIKCLPRDHSLQHSRNRRALSLTRMFF